MTTISTGLSGEYMIEVKHEDGSTTNTGWFKNLILNNGLDRLGANSDTIRYARVGTGSATPTITDVQLQAQIASSATAISSASSVLNSGSPLYQTLISYTLLFAQGAVIGNITEVGIGWTTSGTTLFSRALILDNLGFPTSITLVALDQLTVYYRLNIVPTLTDSTGSVTLSGTPYTYACRVCGVTTFWGTQTDIFQTAGFSGAYGGSINTFPAGSALAAVTAVNPTGTALSQAPSIANATYTAGTYYRDSTWTWTPAQANHVGGLQSIRFMWGVNQYWVYQLRFDTPVPKLNTDTLSLVMRFSWNRV